MKMSELAKTVGVSRQRIYQILQEEGLPTKQHVNKDFYKCPFAARSPVANFAVKSAKSNGVKFQLYAQNVRNFLLEADVSL